MEEIAPFSPKNNKRLNGRGGDDGINFLDINTPNSLNNPIHRNERNDEENSIFEISSIDSDGDDENENDNGGGGGQDQKGKHFTFT